MMVPSKFYNFFFTALVALFLKVMMEWFSTIVSTKSCFIKTMYVHNTTPVNISTFVIVLQKSLYL